MPMQMPMQMPLLPSMSLSLSLSSSFSRLRAMPPIAAQRGHRVRLRSRRAAVMPRVVDNESTIDSSMPHLIRLPRKKSRQRRCVHLPRPMRRMRWMLVAAMAAALPCHASTDITTMELESLLNVAIVGASKYEQKQSAVPAAVSVITRQEIVAYGWRTLGDALASLPGVYGLYDRQYSSLGARGLGLPGDSTTRVLVTINGNRVNDPTYDSGPDGRAFPLDVDLIERIEFIPGPGGAVYGQNAMFGVVNVVTRRGADLNGGELSAAYEYPQSQRTGRATYGRMLDNGIDLLLSVSGLKASGDDLRLDFGRTGLSGVARGLDGENLKQFFASAARGAWSGELVYGNRRKNDPTASVFSDPLLRGQFVRDSYTLAQLQFQDRFADDTLQLSGRLFGGAYRFQTSQRYAGVRTLSPAEGIWRGTEWRLLHAGFAHHKLMVGLEAQDNLRLDQAVQRPDVAGPGVHLRNSGYRVGLYAQDEWQINTLVSATLGARIDRNDATPTHASPRAALIWQATASTTLKALYGRAHRAPNVFERDFDDAGISQLANPDLGGERIDTVELVADHRVGRDLTLRATAYQWTLHGLIAQGTDAASGLTQYRSGARISAQGLELSADKTWARGARLRGSLSSQHVGHHAAGAQPNSPKLLAKLNATSRLPWWDMHAGYELRYDSARTTLSGQRLGGYALSNLHLSTGAFGTGWTVSLHVQNVFDKHYAHPAPDTSWQDALQQDGRVVRLQLDYRF